MSNISLEEFGNFAKSIGFIATKNIDEKPGNGIITATDYATLSSILAGLTVKTPIISLLYDLNKNKILTVTDLSPMSLYIAGKATFTNLNGLT